MTNTVKVTLQWLSKLELFSSNSKTFQKNGKWLKMKAWKNSMKWQAQCNVENENTK